MGGDGERNMHVELKEKFENSILDSQILYQEFFSWVNKP